MRWSGSYSLTYASVLAAADEQPLRDAFPHDNFVVREEMAAIDDGSLTSHIEKLRRVYRGRADAMGNAETAYDSVSRITMKMIFAKSSPGCGAFLIRPATVMATAN